MLLPFDIHLQPAGVEYLFFCESDGVNINSVLESLESESCGNVDQRAAEVNGTDDGRVLEWLTGC